MGLDSAQAAHYHATAPTVSVQPTVCVCDDRTSQACGLEGESALAACRAALPVNAEKHVWTRFCPSPDRRHTRVGNACRMKHRLASGVPLCSELRHLTLWLYWLTCVIH